ncbi:MAG: HAD family phosphatase [Planctomycetota bacterium]
MQNLSFVSPGAIRGVALDMDGLLFDTESLYWKVGDAVLQRRGFRFGDALQQQMMGRVGLDAMSVMIQCHDLDDDAQTLLDESNDLYAQLLQGGVNAMPGLDVFLAKLRRSNLPYGVATSSQKRFAHTILRSHDLIEELQFIITGDDVVQGKPHPEIYQSAARAMGIPVESMLVLEDSQLGARAAVSSGAATVAIPNQNTMQHRFDAVRGIAESLSDPRLLHSLPQADISP